MLHRTSNQRLFGGTAGTISSRNLCFCVFGCPDSIGRRATAELVAKATPGKMAATSSPDSDSGRAERLSPGSSVLPFSQMVLDGGSWALAFEQRWKFWKGPLEIKYEN